jgi:hypothetical protein
LPAITPSGIFEGGRKAELLKKHSGFIALDFDNVQNIAAVKNQIANIQNIFYCGLSVSGGGLWALVPVSNPEYHKEHFNALRIDFLRLGLSIDRACSDVCRLRFYSYDPQPYINFEAIPYEKTFIQPPEPKHQYTRTTNTNIDPLSIAEKMILQASQGELHHTLLKAGHLLGGYIATGLIIESEAVSVLERAISQQQIRSFKAAQKTIKKGIEHGKKTPLTTRHN